MKIIVDCYGADNSPHAFVEGAILSLKTEPDISIILTGNEDALKGEIARLGYTGDRISVCGADSVITNDDSPTMAIRQKRDSSMMVGFEMLRDDQSIDAMITAGSTGAALAGGMFRLGQLEGIDRSAIAALLPTLEGGEVCIVDCGANADCKPEFLLQFAMLGSAYMSAFFGIEQPRVALVSVGTEDKKGNELTLATFELLKNSSLNFVGNMEARDAMTGRFDVLVTDGFVGNVLLKGIEGTGILMNTLLKRAFKSSPLGVLGAVLAKGGLKKMKATIKKSNDRAAPFLGLKKIVLKAHGSVDAECVRRAILQAKTLHQGDIIGKIKAELDKNAG